MATLIDIGHITSLLIKLPARGEINWAQDFKNEFAYKIADHDHSSGKGCRIKNSALVTTDLVGTSTTDVNGNTTAYVASDVAVSTNTIQDSAVTTAKIANDAVDGTKIADNSITAAHIVDGTVVAADVADGAVTTAKLAADSVDGTKIADDSINSEHYVNGSIDTAHIADLQVTTGKLAANAVDSTKLSSNAAGDSGRAVTANHIVSSAIGTNHLASGAVTSTKISTTGSFPVNLNTLANVDTTTPNDNEVLLYDAATTSWGPAALSAAVGVTDTISTPAEAAAYTGTAPFILITASADCTFTNKNFVNRIIFIQDNINVTFQGGAFFRTVIRAGGFNTAKFIHFKNDTSTPIVIEESEILTANSLKLEDAMASSTGLFAKNSKFQVEGTLEVVPTQRDIQLIGCSVQCTILKEDSGTANSIKLQSGTTINCGSLYGNIECLNGIINSSAGISSSGTTSITGTTGSALYSGSTSYGHAMRITKDGIDTKVMVVAKNTFTGDAATDNQLISSTSATKIVMDAEDIDNTSSYDVSNSKFTAKVAGTYSITLSMVYAAITDGVSVRIYKNGSAPAAGAGLTFGSSLTYSTYSVCDATAFMELEVGDYLEFYADSYADSSYSISAADSRIFINKIN